MNYVHVPGTHVEDAWMAGQQRAAGRPGRRRVSVCGAASGYPATARRAIASPRLMADRKASSCGCAGSRPATSPGYFGRFIHVGSSITAHGTELASIDWEAAITALDAGELPSSSGEKRMLRLAASLARDIPVRLGDAVTGIDARNLGLLLKAILHASGRRQFPGRP